jgi:hypothetical protein
MVIVVAAAALVVLDVLAWRFGFDSRLERWHHELRRRWEANA